MRERRKEENVNKLKYIREVKTLMYAEVFNKHYNVLNATQKYAFSEEGEMIFS